jgi:capsular polysaccharide transport system permease protein
MMIAVRESWVAFSNWRLMIWAALYQVLAKQARGSKMMFVLTVLEPLIVISAFYAIRGVLKQNTPNFGTSLFLFYASGLLPYYLFMRISSKTRAAVAKPNSLLPGLSALDVFIATALLNAIIYISMMILILWGIWLYGIDDARPASIVTCAAPVGLFIVLGFGVGMINNVISRFLPMWTMLYQIFTRGLVFLSGVIFIVDLAPIWLRKWMVVNPLSHGVEWFRLGVYGNYPHNSLDRSYLVEWAIIVLFLGFVLDRATMRKDGAR